MSWGVVFVCIAGVWLLVQGLVVFGAQIAGPGSFFNLLAGILLFPAVVLLDLAMPLVRPVFDLLPEKSAWTGVVVIGVLGTCNALFCASVLVGLMRFGSRPGCRL